ALALLAAACGDGRRDDARRGDARRGETATADRRRDTAATVRTPCATPLWEGVDTTGGAERKVARHPVNRGTRGMFAQLRWSRSPDGCAMLVVEDPAAVEADPVPDGFLHVSERGPTLLQRDGVWDVSPSVDWERLAYARAFGAQPRGAADSLSPAEWQRLAVRVGLDAELVRRSGFSCSGMTYAYCVARLYVAEHDTAQDTAQDTVRALPVLAGWRVRWRADGSAILAGIAPQGSQDHAPPTRWVVVDPRTGAARDTVGAADTVGVAPTAWHEGPMLTYGVALDLASPSELRIDNAEIRSGGGWIHVHWRGPSGAEYSFRVGSGRALAATRGGRFIAAIVPGRPAPGQEWAYDAVVYQVSR
ncbi:MAG: hypothetical protein M3282_12710, partial [Gemmatimonadota bacterium]|nr:hypothetical protein [Gemmatimonadota bacterium]